VSTQKNPHKKLAFELTSKFDAPPLFSLTIDQFVTPPKTRFGKRDFSGVAENSSDRERAKKGGGASNLLDQFKRRDSRHHSPCGTRPGIPPHDDETLYHRSHPDRLIGIRCLLGFHRAFVIARTANDNDDFYGYRQFLRSTISYLNLG